MTVGDDQKAIEQAMCESVGRCDMLIISGGIGPTADDLTRQALAAMMNVPLELNETWLARLKEFFTKVGRAMPQSNTIQAMIPRGARMIGADVSVVVMWSCTDEYLSAEADKPAKT